MSIKKISLIALAILPMTVFAAYSAKVPLEVLNGGSLPDGSIVIGDGSSAEPSNPPSSNCLFDENSSVTVFENPPPFFPYSAGDTFYRYNGDFIGYSMAGYPAYIPSGVSMGSLRNEDVEFGTKSYEICADDLSIYPPVTTPDSGGEPEPENPGIQACLDKRPQVISIIESYGSSLSNLMANADGDTVYCVAEYSLPDGQARTDVINDLNAIGVLTAM